MAAHAALLAAVNAGIWFNLNSTSGCALYRREFDLPRKPDKAEVGFTAAGYGEVWINGAKADSTAVLEPGWTQWDKRLLVPMYDVTDQLKEGRNVVGLALAAGWFGHLQNIPAAKLGLTIHLPEDLTGKTKNITIITDEDWTVGPCPVDQSDIYLGEIYDARKELMGWSSPEASTPLWPKVTLRPPAPVLSKTVLSPQPMAPIRALALLTPEFVTMSKDGATIIDFGQNIAGWVQLSLNDCTSGAVVTIRHGEFLIDNRTAIHFGNLRGAKATDVYTCKGGAVKHEPSFTYHGFRYAEVSVLGSASWSWHDLRARVVHSDVKPRGELNMHSTVLMDVHRAIRWTQLDNLHSVPTDCPQRDERQGWMADASVSAEQALLNFDMRDFYLNWLQVIVDTQQSTFAGDCKITVPGGGVNGTCLGAVTDTSPHVKGLFGTRPADPSWGAALPILVDLVNRYYGWEAVQPFVPAAHAWATFLLSMRQDGVVKYHNYGDWLEPGKVPSTAIVSEMSAAFNSIMAVQIASEFGDAKDRAHFTAESANMLAAFNHIYWNTKISAFGDGSQAPQVYALHMGGLSTEREHATLKVLLTSLDRQGIDTGIIATKWLFPLLSKYNRTDLGLKLASGTAFPSWGYMIAKGATTIWENWNAYRAPSGDRMSSHNHPAFTSVGAWFYTDLVGIRVDRMPIELGTTLSSYDPLLPWASGQVQTSDGEASVSWHMRPYVRVEGKCPSACVVRVPLDGMPMAEALQSLLGSEDTPFTCGTSICIRVAWGAFHFELKAEEMSGIVI